MKRLTLFVCLAYAATASAEDSSQLSKISQQLESLSKTVSTLQTLVQGQNLRIQTLEKENASLRSVASAPTGRTPAFPTPAFPTSQAAASSGAYVPEIGLVGDIVGTSSQSEEDAEGNDRIAVRELELIIGHDVDPYSRFDATIVFSDFEDVAIEEAFLTHWGIPGDFKLRIGRMRPRLGLATAVHRDALETVDEPLVIQRYLGVEGLFKTGAEISNFLPLPWETVTHEVITGMIEGGAGEDGTLFGETGRRPTFYGRLKNFWEISYASNVQLSGSYLIGSSDEDSSNEVKAFGTDLVFNHRLNSINKLVIKTEALFQNRDEGLAVVDELAGELPFRKHPWGMYTTADYRFEDRWSAGGRWDYVQPVLLGDEGSRGSDRAWSAFVTFHQSEFARWRFQYQRINFADTTDDNRFFVQGTFAIGTHKHSIQ